MKKVRRLGGGVSGGDSCPLFDGVQVYADPASCNQFYKCENGTMTLETCENGLLFDQEMVSIACRPKPNVFQTSMTTCDK